jgi:hypothetical protein
MAKAQATTSEKNMAESTSRVAFDLTPAVAAEVERILKLTDLGSKPEVFRRAFTLLRIHVNAAIEGKKIFLVDPANPEEKYIITLPFNVATDKTNTE